jgi:glycerate 2-kinase
MTDRRATVREIFFHALREASVERAFHKHVEYLRGTLRVCDDLLPVQDFAKVLVVAFGKAAVSMTEALAGQLGALAGGIVVAPETILDGRPRLPGFRYFAGGHPLPNAESVRAAEAILKSLAALPERALALYLISGGGSAMVERPAEADTTLEDLIATYDVLLRAGAPIMEMNAIRKHLSAVKGGRMARAAGQGKNVQQVTILVSDVPPGALDALASGPTMPDPTTAEQCYAIAQRYGLVERLPGPVRELFTRRALEETPKKDDPIFRHARWWPVLTNADALQVAAARAEELGYRVEQDVTCDDQDYACAADHLLARARELRRASRGPVCVISGGEVTVRLGEAAGVGGRNQQWALYCASRICGENITVLSAGMDGIDGNSPAAGAVADGSTVARWSSLGHGRPVSEILESCDAFPLFQELGDTILTGPTGNNIRDLRMVLVE